jgi:hypothetical protein
METPSHRRPGVAAAVRWGVAVVLVGSVAASVLSQWSKLPDVRWRWEPGWLAVSVLGFAAFLLSHAEAWRRMLSSLRQAVPPVRAHVAFCASLLGRYVPTGVMAYVARIAIAERDGVPKRVTSSILVYELALGLAAAIALSDYLLVTLPSLRGEPWRWALVAVPALTVAALHPRVFGPLVNGALRRLGREPLAVTLSLGRIAFFLAFYAAGFLAAGAGVYGLAHAVAPVGASDAGIVLTSYSLAFVAGMLGGVLPGGLGAREAGLVAGLSPVMPVTAALAVAVAARLLQTAVELAYAGLVGLAARRSPLGSERAVS